MNIPKTLLRIEASARREGSVTRQLGDEVEARWLAHNPGAQVRLRDLADALPLLDQAWVEANLTEAAGRSPEQNDTLALSDALIEELEHADALLITVPLYNFGIPAALKAWIDLVCRARKTFAYTEQGPCGLLVDRPVYLVYASGGVPQGSAMDFASAYLKQVLGFIGLQDIQWVAAEQLNLDEARAMAQARAQIQELFGESPSDLPRTA